MKRPVLAAALTLALAAGLPALPASAMAIAVREVPNTDVTAVWLTGQIEANDAQAFHETVKDVPKAIVFLEGPGGVTVEGLAIGNEIRERRFTTMVSAGRTCMSACALAWLGGVNLAMADSARVGFHATFVEVGDEKVTSSVGNAIVGAYMARLGVPDATIAWMSKADPESISTLTPAVAQSLGMSIQVVSGDRVTRTAPLPVAARGAPDAAEAAPAAGPAVDDDAGTRQRMSVEAVAAADRYAAAVSAGRRAGARFDVLYGPAVSLDGVVAHHDEAVAADARLAARAGRTYAVRPSSTAANCAPKTGICSITGIMDWTSTRRGRDASGSDVFGLAVSVGPSGDHVIARTFQPLREATASASGGRPYQSSRR